MNPRIIEEMGWDMGQVYASVTDRILVNLARHFKRYTDGSQFTGAWDYQVRMLAQVGQVREETVKILYDSLTGEDAALKNLLTEMIASAVEKVEPELQKAVDEGFLTGAAPVMSANQTQAFKSYYRQSAEKMNLVNTTMLQSTVDVYQGTVADITGRMMKAQRILNQGTGQVVAGVTTLNQAVREGVEKMVANGITGFVDNGGHRWTPEAYVTMDMRTTLANTGRQAVWETMNSYGDDLYCVSWHDGARPLCYPWQGKVISRSGWTGEVDDLDGNKVHVYSQSETSYGEAAGLFGINCGHYPIPFIPGMSKARQPEQNEEENRKEYEESQKQRALERELREKKRDLEVLKAQGAPADEIKAQRAKVAEARDNLDQFCEDTGRARRSGRERTQTDAQWPTDNGAVRRFDGQYVPVDQPVHVDPVPSNPEPAVPAHAEQPKVVPKYDFGGDKATITEEGQTIIRDTIRMLQEQYPIPEGFELNVTDFRVNRGIGFDEDLFDALDRLEQESPINEQFFGVKAEFHPSGSGGKTLNIQYIDTTMPEYTPKETVFEEIHQAGIRTPGGKPFNAGWGYECDTIHEYGHLLSHVYGFYQSEDLAFVEWFNTLDKEEIKRQLSIYAATNWNEFFAEAFLQSFSPYQSDLSKQAMEYLRKKMIP